MAKTSNGGMTKAQRVAKAVADAVGAGRAVQLETVDFNDPQRPKTCLEVDFPILPVNQVAVIEGNAGKPIYQMSKWWARRRSSVFRSLLLAAAMKAPEDASQSAKAVWDVYYANHQKKRSFAKLKVADIFMGGGTTIVEGSRLGMQMFGNDLNPVAWFVVKTELADVKQEEVEALLADIEAEVKPQIMPFYECRGPHGERGTWTRVSDGQVMGADFDPLALKPDERKAFKYDGPEVIYEFWAKHGPCQVTGCGHRTPVMSSPVVAVKELSIKKWPHRCMKCKTAFDIEESEVRMAPDVPLVVVDGEKPFAPIGKNGAVVCPSCGREDLVNVDKLKSAKAKVSLTLLIHPQWLAGEASKDKQGRPYGGSVTDDAESTARWLEARAKKLRFVEVRGTLPAEVTCPETGVTFSTSKGTVPKKSHYACGACGTVQDVLTTVKASGKTGPVAPYVIQAYSPKRDHDGVAYGGRYFMPADEVRGFVAAQGEWDSRKEGDLAVYWPRSALPYGFMTHILNGGIPNHGFTHWWAMFNPRQLLVNGLLLKTSVNAGGSRFRWEAREYVLAAFQQYLRNQNMFCFWNPQRDTPEPMFSNNNFHPKATTVENCVFPRFGRGNWETCSGSLLEVLEWSAEPWELVSNERLAADVPTLREALSGKSEKATVADSLTGGATLSCKSATELESVEANSFDMVITDPPFGGLLHYAELADFFYVWLRLVLKERYPDSFTGEYTPKTLEAVSNRARRPDDADAHYQRLLTASWQEAHRTLKVGGVLAFTFHHSEDAPWVSVLESLFDAGFYLEATYPIRSDETKGDGEFGSKQIEYDIIHVCRKRTEEPMPVSWAKMRRQVLADIDGLKRMLELHQKAGLPANDLRIIKIGKALEYYSRHYGKVLFAEQREMSVKDALLAIFQLIDEQSGPAQKQPPQNAEALTRQFLRLFDGVTEVPRDQMQKSLRGTGIVPADFEARGWCVEEKKTFLLTSPIDVAKAWQRKHRTGMTSDYDQAMFLIGACFEGSGINANETLNNANFKPHAALEELLEWFQSRGQTPDLRSAASVAQTLVRAWRTKQQTNKQYKAQLEFFGEGDAA